MKVRRSIALLCAPLLATGVAACGATTTSTSSFKGEQQKVAQTVAHLRSHATGLEAKKICGEDLAAANVARLNASSEGCKKAIESQLKEIDNFEATVESVTISGNTAVAHVKGVLAGKKAIQTLSFVKEGSRWKISGTVGFAAVSKPAASGKS
jgi:Putative lumazine-binding